MSEKPSKEELMEQLKSVMQEMEEHRKKFPKACANLRPTPPPMTFDAALNAANPLAEISARIRGPYESMNEPEQIFWKARYFKGDTFNGGYVQTFENSTGDNFPDVEKFVNEYCAEPLRQIFRELKQLFPDGRVPTNREERCIAIKKMPNAEDLLDALDGRFYALENEFDEGLLALARKHRKSFRGLK